MNKKGVKTAILLFILVFAAIIGVGYYYVRRNTSFLTPSISKEEVKKNNENFDTTKITTQELIVPTSYKVGEFKNPHSFTLPENFEISVYAAGMDAPRFFDFDQENNMYVADKDAGKIMYIPDTNHDGIGDRVVEFDKGLENPHGIDYFDGDLFVAEEGQVVVYRAITADGKYFKKEVLIKDLPKDAGHATRTIQIGTDNKIYLAVGSSCNVCEEKDQRRAAIVRYNLDGTGEEIFASGLRNTVGFTFEPGTNNSDFKIWGVDNGRDLIGDDIPPEEVNLISQGKNYGWPYCYGNKIANPEYTSKQDFCTNQTEAPAYELQAHSAPLAITMMPKEFDAQKVNFPEALNNNFFISFHGSWNRSVPTGYKVVRIDKNATDKKAIDFITGWLDESGNVWGRPVGVKFDLNGDMFISDDKAGAIYKIISKKTM